MDSTRGALVEWSIQEIARLAGTTSRTLRHYHAIGLLALSIAVATAALADSRM